MIHTLRLEDDGRALNTLPRYEGSGLKAADVSVSRTMTPFVTAIYVGFCSGCGEIKLRSFMDDHECKVERKQMVPIMPAPRESHPQR